MRIALLIFFVSVSANMGFSQLTISKGWMEPSPEIGWDSLESRIVYPELARRAGLEGCVWSWIRIDSLGYVDSISTHWLYGEIFVEPVVKAIRSTRWSLPKYLNSWHSIPVFFFLKNSQEHHHIIIQADRPKIDVMK